MYVEKERTGPDHEPMFTMAVMVNDKEIAFAKGRKKSDAEKEAAKIALEKYQSNKKQTLKLAQNLKQKQKRRKTK